MDNVKLTMLGTGNVIVSHIYNTCFVVSSDNISFLVDAGGGESNDWLTTMGNLRLVTRNIESKDSIASKFSYDFIDLNLTNYSGSARSYTNPIFGSPGLCEPGRSLFLDYKETEDFVVPFKQPSSTSSSTSSTK
jgi:hypothetical protein